MRPQRSGIAAPLSTDRRGISGEGVMRSADAGDFARFRARLTAWCPLGATLAQLPQLRDRISESTTYEYPGRSGNARFEAGDPPPQESSISR